MNTGTLYIVATPIGNLADMTIRALSTLEQVDLVVCEDTRVTRKLLSHYQISSLATSFYQLNKREGGRKPEPKTDFLLTQLRDGKNLALVTDAGTPGISDPGNQLVENAIKAGIAIIPIPGASAVTTLISVSGIDMTRFTFLGFPPHKKGRETFFREVVDAKYPVVLFDSPHRIIKNLELLESLSPEKKVVLGREMTKMFEEVVRGTVREVIEHFGGNEKKIKGEIVLIVY
jgi:16S rRNA (cytidine1402-2'-O)-methyltransferase